MGSVNKVILVGNLGKDPEVKHFDKGSVARFSMATTESYKDKAGNKQSQTEWHNIEIWGDLAKVAEKWLKKGSQIYLEGSLKTDSWEDNGVKKYATKIRGISFTMLGSSSEKATTDTASQQSNTGEEIDDLPF